MSMSSCTLGTTVVFTDWELEKGGSNAVLVGSFTNVNSCLHMRFVKRKF